MLIGALGIAIGLAMYGPKLIKTVGSEITELDQARAFSVAIASAIVVIIASWLGLPVSSTHIAIGGIFGVGFLRIYIDGKYKDKIEGIINARAIAIQKELDSIEDELTLSPTDDRRAELLKLLSTKKDELLKTKVGVVEHFSKKEKKSIKKIEKEKYIKKEMLIKIIAAWLITVPASALLSAFLFFTIKGFML
jgi:PiT family inorganic phosphate transporter